MTKKVGQFTVQPTAGIQVAAAQIATSTRSSAETAGTVPALRQGIVASVEYVIPRTCTVTFDGTTNVAGVACMSNYDPTAGDLVTCLTLNGSVQIVGSPSGGGQNITERQRSTTWNQSSSGNWMNVHFDSDDATIQCNESGTPIYTNPYFNSPILGLYTMSAVVTTPATAANNWGVRWITNGGAILARRMADLNNLDIMTLTTTRVMFPDTKVCVQVTQDSGGTVVLPANSSTTPFYATFGCVG